MNISIDMLMDNALTQSDNLVDEFCNNNLLDSIEWKNNHKQDIQFKLRLFFLTYHELRERIKPYTKYIKQNLHLKMIRYYKENLSNYDYTIPKDDLNRVEDEFYTTMKKRFPEMIIELDLDRENTKRKIE